MVDDTKMNFKNPVIAAQVLESPFVPDPIIGHTMPYGKDFIGENNYVGIDEMIAEIKNSKRKVILNMGDSSTSGWDSNIVTQNRERMAQGRPLAPAFFHYKTYSDYLRMMVKDKYVVINAGVPAHTSLQGYLRLKILLERFKKEEVDIQLVTLYYGNNDSVWDHNREDKEWVGKKPSILNDILKRIFKKKTHPSITTRVSPIDYKKNMRAMIETCKNYKLQACVIEPLTPLYWKPGTRVLNEDLERSNYPGSAFVYNLLDEGLSLWQQAKQDTSYSPLKISVFEQVRENDFVVPRIKKGHLAMLRSVARETKVPYLRVELDRTMDDIRYFIDYCHPIGDANKHIAEKIFEIISGAIVTYDAEETEAVQAKPSAPIKLELPTKHYTLY